MGFREGAAVLCRFGGTVEVTAVVVDSNTMTCTTPLVTGDLIGSTAVQVSANGGTDWSAPLAFDFEYAPPCYTCQAPKNPVCTKTPVMELYYMPELANVTKTNYSINRTTGWVNETITSMVNQTVNETTSLVNVSSIVTKLANITTNV